jgi:hypothetical protein
LDSIWFSQSPYVYLTDDIIKYNDINSSTVFTVKIANQLTGGYTTGYMCSESNCSGNEAFDLLLKTGNTGETLAVSVLGNPVRNVLGLQTSGNYTGPVDVRIYSMSGSLVFSSQLTTALPVEFHEISLNAGMDPGIYIITCQYNNSRTAPVKLVVY